MIINYLMDLAGSFILVMSKLLKQINSTHQKCLFMPMRKFQNLNYHYFAVES